MARYRNIFTTLLALLKVKHTKSFSSQYFNEHPDKNSIYGLSKMLSYYRIENEGLKLKSKDILAEIDTPFVAHVDNDFAIVQKIDDQYVEYISNGKKEKTTIEKFKNSWFSISTVFG